MKQRAFFLVFFLSSLQIGATHLRCGYISIKHLGNRSCQVTLKVYTNSGSDIRFGEGELSFGDGTTINTPTTENAPRPDLGPNIAIIEFSTTHVYNSLGSYLVSYREANRNAGIINFENSVETRFYIESFFTIRSDNDPYRSPVFLTDPIFKSELGNDYTASLAAVDSNAYRLVYFSSIPQRDRGLAVVGHQQPPSFNINGYNGVITWDGSFSGANLVGEFLFAATVCQFEDDELIGYVGRDIDIIVEDVGPRSWIDDTRSLDANNKLVIAPLDEDCVKIIFHVPGNSSPAQMNVYSELLNVPGVVSYVTYDSTYSSAEFGTVYAKVMKLKINSISAIDRDLPYLVTVRGTVSSRSKDIAYLIYTRLIDDSEVPEFPGLPIAEGGIQPNPNPVIYELRFGSVDRATLYSTLGTTVAEVVYPGHIMDVHELPAGIYVLVLEQSGQPTESYRIIKH